jgi:DDE family transposase
MLDARYACPPGSVRPIGGAAARVRLSRGLALGLFHAGTGALLKLVVAPLITHDLAQVQAVHPSLQPGDVLVADRGLCSYAHLALLVQAGVHAVLRVGARQIVDFTPGRPFVRPSVRRTSAVKGVPRSRWLKSLGVHDQLVAWLKPKACPSWLARETLAALPDTLLLREVRYFIGRPGFRTRQITLVITLLGAAVYRVVDLTELYRRRCRSCVCWAARAEPCCCLACAQV